MHYLKRYYYFILLSALTFIFSCSGEKEVDFQKADLLLKNIASYNYGDSRTDLSALETMVHKTHNTPDERIMEKKLISFIESDATFAGKQFVCRQLSIIGTSEAVPALKKLLLDSKTSDIALYALQRIPAAEADKTLIEALNATDGNTRIGIINCIGERKNRAAVKQLAVFAADPDKTTAKAAICALGKIANDEAAKQLNKIIIKQKGELKAASMDALLKCADADLKKGKNQKALLVYKKYDNSYVPVSIRTAAIYGILKADPQNAAAYTLKVLQGKDSAAKDIVIKELRNLKDKSQLGKIAAQLPHLSPRHQVQLISALADIGDTSVKGYVLNAVRSKNAPVRAAALQALAALGNADEVFLLAAVAASAGRTEQDAARESLYRLHGEDVNSVIIKTIEKSPDEIKVELIKSLAERGAGESVPDLLKLTKDKSSTVRENAVKVLGELASAEYLPQMLDVLEQAQSENEKSAAVLAAALTAKKITAAEKQTELILKRLDSAKDDSYKISLIRVLGKIGSDNSLNVLREALKSNNSDIRLSAIKALSEWPTDAPINDLLTIAKTSKDDLSKTLALRGFITLIGINDKRDDKETVNLYKQAMELAERTNEKRMILSGLSDIRNTEALNLALSFLPQKDIRDEVETAVVKIAGRIRGDHPQEAKKALEKIIASSNNEYIKNRAQGELKRIK